MSPRGGKREGAGRPTKSPAGPSERVWVRLAPDVLARARAAADAAGLTLAQWIAQAIASHLLRS